MTEIIKEYCVWLQFIADAFILKYNLNQKGIDCTENEINKVVENNLFPNLVSCGKICISQNDEGVFVCH